MSSVTTLVPRNRVPGSPVGDLRKPCPREVDKKMELHDVALHESLEVAGGMVGSRNMSISSCFEGYLTLFDCSCLDNVRPSTAIDLSPISVVSWSRVFEVLGSLKCKKCSSRKVYGKEWQESRQLRSCGQRCQTTTGWQIPTPRNRRSKSTTLKVRWLVGLSRECEVHRYVVV